MDIKRAIAKRAAQEVLPGSLVNLGIGLPSLVANFIPQDAGVFFQAENGVIGMGARPPEGMEDPDLTDAGGGFITAVPGAAAMDSAFSFGLIRGGHVDLTILGGLQVDQTGLLANWKIPGAMIPGMGGAMDLVSGAKRVIVTMSHTAHGIPKLVKTCDLPITSRRKVDLIITELAVLRPTPEGLQVIELAENVSLEYLASQTDARLVANGG